MTAEPSARYHDAPVDEAARERLAASGLELRRVGNDDKAAFDGWFRAVARGFLGAEPSDERRDGAFDVLAQRRIIGVYDAEAPVATTPVATFDSWVEELSVPGGRGIPSCAISAVTVAATHRRRGIARAMMEGELRQAAAAGVPVAVLTVSEATLYGRYGFGSAAAAASWRIESRRAGWIGPLPTGRVDFVTPETWTELAAHLHERVRLRSPGELVMPRGHWGRFVRTNPGADDPGKVRAVQYTAADGRVTGAAVYSVEENHDDFTKSTATISYLLAEDADAYAGLWRFFLQLDLIGEVRADQLSVDEPLLWMIADQRAARVSVVDHQYVRILDVPAALGARTYGAPGLFALDVTDPLGIAEGRWILSIDAAGRGAVDPWEGEAPDGAVVVALGITELSAAYLGGVSLATLAFAGRVETSDPDAAARAFRWHTTPRLSFWY